MKPCTAHFFFSLKNDKENLHGNKRFKKACSLLPIIDLSERCFLYEKK